MKLKLNLTVRRLGGPLVQREVDPPARGTEQVDHVPTGGRAGRLRSPEDPNPRNLRLEDRAVAPLNSQVVQRNTERSCQAGSMSSKQIGQLLADDEASFLHVIRVRRHPSGL